MGNISSVLKAKRKELGLTLAQIAEKIGVTEATVQRWESGNIKSLRHERIAKLADILGVTPSVLMGWDEPTAPTLPSPTITEDTVTFPVITSVAAHYDSVSIDESAAGEKIEVPRAYLKGRKAEDFCAMRVRGDSMYPAFQNGDIVLVLRQSTMNHSGEIGVISYGDDEMTIKRINYVDGEDWLKLVPLNPAYPPRRIEGVDLESCHIIGIPQVLIREYFENCLAVARWDQVDALAHLGYLKRYAIRDGVTLDYTPYDDLIDEILCTLIATGKALEVNTSGFRYGLPEWIPGIEIWRRYRAMGGELVTIGSDAHRPEDIGAGHKEAQRMLRELGFTRFFYFRARKPVAVEL